MIAFQVNYQCENGGVKSTLVDSKNIRTAKTKIERKEKETITIISYHIIGYY